ncbi:MAG: hypothetical protein CVT72_11710 [Alphaproteobacteria bacterium HGW-Alphaproteobacteria-11]|nr:MAG: hypothetical protein CVT72_11710 [Alphaproteobacteria bacterium HGW-Alphaproteobacteria-11]
MPSSPVMSFPKPQKGSIDIYFSMMERPSLTGKRRDDMKRSGAPEASAPRRQPEARAGAKTMQIWRIA